MCSMNYLPIKGVLTELFEEPPIPLVFQFQITRTEKELRALVCTRSFSLAAKPKKLLASTPAPRNKTKQKQIQEQSINYWYVQ